MVDFMEVSAQYSQKKGWEVFPRFIARNSKDLMVRGGNFYAVWVEELGVWSTNIQDVYDIIDRELDKYVSEHQELFGEDKRIDIKYYKYVDSGTSRKWREYVQQAMADNYKPLDDKLIFANDPIRRSDYASKRLPYALESGDISAWNKLIGTLYEPKEREKIEWAIGAIVSGDSKKLQKFLVFYGPGGTGKSTVINILNDMFVGYVASFEAGTLGDAHAQFALEQLKNNPLVAIQHDGDLSRIENNARINSLVSHESMLVNEKYMSTYEMVFKCFLILGTNKPVRITDSRSGIIRRLIDVSPTGTKIPPDEYDHLMEKIKFEHGAIAQHCLDFYKANKRLYDKYKPVNMMGATDDFYNFILDYYNEFSNESGISLSRAYEMYKQYCGDANITKILTRTQFKEELRNYYRSYTERGTDDNGDRRRSWYSGFKKELLQREDESDSVVAAAPAQADWLNLVERKSVFDEELCNALAQYANAGGNPTKKWANVTSILASLDPHKLHYVKVPLNHIVIDFDLKDENGNKSFALNKAAASKWPKTYAEVSKGGQGIHLHYIYTGDPLDLSAIYDKDIEIKVFKGDSSLRRRLTRCNDLDISTITSGLPLKEKKVVINDNSIKSDKELIRRIKKCLNREYENVPSTKSNIDLINKMLQDAYESGLHYDVTSLRPAVLSFAMQSSNQADICIKIVNKMRFKSEDVAASEANDSDKPLAIFDCEVFPNLLLINWKLLGEGKPIVRMIQPTPEEVDSLVRNHRLVGFNCLRYDNHILYARILGWSNAQIYNLSKSIISNSKNAGFRESKNVSYTDVYDFSAKKQSLKKFEIELADKYNLHHKELAWPWDQPVPEEKWCEVAEYCDNDVLSTEAVWNDRQADFKAREILADLAGMTVNDTTNNLTGRIIFGNDRKPQSQFNYRRMGDTTLIAERKGEYEVFDDKHRPIFPGYLFDHGVSTYRGEEVGEGGYVYAEKGMHILVALLDVESMHPSSAIDEQLFGKYTDRFNDILQARFAIKHKDFEKARTMLDGALAKYLDDESQADALAQALKIAINSVYGLTSASFDNLFKDPRNIDNIVAKRGALFMINLKHAVQERGYTVAHIKTDSIKIPEADMDIIKFVIDYGHDYGYNFAHEATYDRMCLVNNAVYIARYASMEQCYDLYGKEYCEATKDTLKDNKKHPYAWTATGTQFQVPYVFKTLFSGEPIEFSDLNETKSATTCLYLDMNEGLDNVLVYEELRDTRKKFQEWKSGDFEKNRKAGKLLDQYFDISDEQLDELIKNGHDYQFVGKVGSFCPVKPGCGGGVLLREGTDKKTGLTTYSSVTGAKGYRWLESETVRVLGDNDIIDLSYYNALVDAAIDEMAKYCDVERFRAEEPFTKQKVYPWTSGEDDDYYPFDVR